MGTRFVDIPFVGDVVLEWPSVSRGRTFIDGEVINGKSYALWIGSFHLLYDPPKRSPAWVLGALLLIGAAFFPNPLLPTATDNAIREAMGFPHKHEVSRGEYAQLCREWPMLTMCRTGSRAAGLGSP